MNAIADALRELVRATYHMTGTDDTFPNAHAAARDALAAHDAAVAAGGWWRGGDRTCGPSAAAYRFIRDASGIVAYVEGPRAIATERAARIVACVNACEGIADPAGLVRALRTIAGGSGSAAMVARAALGGDA